MRSDGLEKGLPTKMTRAEFVVQFNDAMRLKAAGAPVAAVEILRSLLDKGHPVAALVGEIGGILYYDIGNPSEALPFLQRSVELSPRSELASLGLFHALLALDRVDEAFDEMRRYLKDGRSEAYAEFLRDANAE